MQTNVSQLLKESIGSVRNLELSEIIDIFESDAGRLVEGKVRLMRTDRGILVNGILHTEVEASCSRCLAPSKYSINVNIDEEYFPTTDVFSGAPLTISSEPGCFTIDKYHILDLTEAIRQYALMEMPLKVLCREDCAGLCPNCGHSLNEGTCGCPPQEIDTRWAALKKLALS